MRNVIRAFPSRILLAYTRFRAITLAQLKASDAKSLSGKDSRATSSIYSEMQAWHGSSASCYVSFSPFLFDAASSDVVHPTFLHISQLLAPYSRQLSPQ